MKFGGFLKSDFKPPPMPPHILLLGGLFCVFLLRVEMLIP